MLALRLRPDFESRLDKLAKLTGRSKSYHAREAILERLDELEDMYLTEQRLADLRAGRSEAVPLREIVKRHGVRD
jgi:RHH-type transcriptional regulator, rel operon repressor / antitoxin RelB